MKGLTEDHLATLRRHMVEVIDIEYELTGDDTSRPRMDERLRGAMLSLPRHLFVPPQLGALAYQDRPLPIGFDKTISQPFMSALMIDLLDLRPGDRVLEVGTGLGYQTALLADLAGEVWSVDVVEEFVVAAAQRLRSLDKTNVTLRVGDGSRGWPDQAPFDAILVSAAAKEMPSTLAGQLEVGGRMVLPIGDKGAQKLTRVERTSDDEVAAAEVMLVQFTELETGP
ncbi:protein-L-isoaspartate(D-aspartate) O-methyltransferase [Sphingomonas lenta]|uniref:Protein-L-isoaspartate O-methyltransferase n=1 Tax=Sphingomonas lenta TaxID=1141887 RepID=A0A2A2SGS4_9SPHN|nr:protein-L-isoaspartate(D-aspartate) O-methyltransferase [Sphingomonas lenta]PAX08457.1 protein-L-isoaspartate O-methyltransferase [Sphingomonas lenta]